MLLATMMAFTLIIVVFRESFKHVQKYIDSIMCSQITITLFSDYQSWPISFHLIPPSTLPLPLHVILKQICDNIIPEYFSMHVCKIRPLKNYSTFITTKNRQFLNTIKYSVFKLRSTHCDYLICLSSSLLDGILYPPSWGHLAISRNTFHWEWWWYRNLVSRGQGCCWKSHTAVPTRKGFSSPRCHQCFCWETLLHIFTSCLSFSLVVCCRMRWFIL